MNSSFTLCFCVFCFCALFSTVLQAQDLTPEKIRIYTTADGLPDNSVFCMDQDKKGNLWIGTRKGASKFDGKSFTNYSAKDGFSDKPVWAILCDSKGFIWFGTEGDGLFRFDGNNWKWFTKEKDGFSFDNFFNGFLYEDNRGNIWGLGFLKVFKYNNGRFVMIDYSGTGAIEDNKGNLYIADGMNRLYKLLIKEPTRFMILSSQFNTIGGIAVDQNLNLWVADDFYISKSDDYGNTFAVFKYEPDKIGSESNCWDLLVDNDNQVWTGNTNYVARFDGSKFHYYNQQNGFPASACYYIFQDQQGNIWFCFGTGLAKFDSIPPIFEPPAFIPSIVKSQTLSFQFKGNDGKLGSYPEELSYEYKFAYEKKWKKAGNGKVNLDKLQDNTKYEIQLRITDGFHNRAEAKFSFIVQIDTDIPNVIVTNRHEFLKSLDKQDFIFYFSGKDDQTVQEDILFRHKLEKDGRIILNWSGKWSKIRKASFQNLQNGEYSFCVQAKDEVGNKSEIYKLIFTVDSIVDKPRIALNNITSCCFVEQDNRPVLKCGPIEQEYEITSGRISFLVKNIDNRPEKKELQYSVQLEPEYRNWTLYRDNNRYEFSDLPDGNYHLKVRAKDKENIVSVPLHFTFEVKGFQQLPQTQILFGEDLRKGKIVGRIFDICWETDKEYCSFSYKLNDGNWSAFHPLNCFETPFLSSDRHTFRVLSKNDFGIEPMPAIHEFDYERIHDLPIIRLTSKIKDVVASNSLIFQFEAEDDMEYGDRTPAKELLYSWRLIPVNSHWSRPFTDKTATFSNLKNGSYFFQVKAIDKSDNECIVPAERFFEVRIVPFYRKTWFVWSISGSGIVLAAFFTFILTRRRTKKNIYEQRYNPYIVGEAVHDPEMFFGREIIMKDIFQSLKNNSLCLTGERRIGKTTILEHIDKNTEKPLFSFFCNLEAVKEEMFFSRIMQHFVNKIQADFKDAPSSLALFEKERQEYDDLDFEDDMETVLGFLKKCHDPRVSIIMCLDEIDSTQDFSNETHQSLRNVFQTYQGIIRLVTAGVSIKRGDWYLPTSPWYNFFEFKSISAIDKEKAALLITKPVKGFYIYDNRAVDFILQKTDGRPFYIQTICKKAITRILDEKRRKVTLNDVKKIYNDLIHLELNREFETFWEEVSTELQRMIIQTANHGNMPLSKEHEFELFNNTYNHGHKVITIHNGKMKFSTIFRDWLEINYVKSGSDTSKKMGY